jgi:histone H1/5
MSIEKPLRELVQAELKTRLGPLHKAVGRMNARLDVLEELEGIIRRLAPLATRMQSLQLALPGVGVPAGRAGAGGETDPHGRVRQAQAAEVVPPPRRGPPSITTGSPVQEGRRCAIMGCRRPSRSKGYCSAHYQKLRLLVKTGRRPEKWVDDAQPQSVPDVVLPRGRAAAKAREEAPPVAPQRPEPPKPKAWVRKKGAQERVSLH